MVEIKSVLLITYCSGFFSCSFGYTCFLTFKPLRILKDSSERKEPDITSFHTEEEKYEEKNHSKNRINLVSKYVDEAKLEATKYFSKKKLSFRNE